MYRFDEDNLILATNGSRLSKFLGISIKDDTKLNDELSNKVVKDFIIKYEKYLNSNKIEDIKEFYNLTGLMLTHIFNISESRSVIYSMNNIFRIDTTKDVYRHPTYTTHILVVSNKSDNNDNKYYSDVFWKNESEYELGRNIRYTMSCVCKNTRDKIRVIESKYNKNAFKDIDKSKIKDINITTLNNLCILLNNGNLYLDNRLYATNVDTIWHQDSYNSYIIYKDNKLENLTSKFPNTSIYKYKKIVYNNYMLATLKNKRVGITQLVDQSDTSVLTTIYDVDDIIATRNSLYLIKDNKKIRIPSWYNTIVTNN